MLGNKPGGSLAGLRTPGCEVDPGSEIDRVKVHKQRHFIIKFRPTMLETIQYSKW